MHTNNTTAAAPSTPCHCIIRHAKTDDERAAVAADLRYSREVRDSIGIALALAALSPCPSR